MYPSPVRFHPWVGRYYNAAGFGGFKILILGESHYSPKPEDQFDSALTQKIFTHYAIGDKPLRFFKTLACLIAGAASRTALSRETYLATWQACAFYNYVQDLLPAARMRPTPEMWDAAKEPFTHVLENLKPHIVLVAGKQLGWHIPNLPQDITTIGMKHPSAFGFSYARALQHIAPQLPDGFDAARAIFAAHQDAD